VSASAVARVGRSTAHRGWYSAWALLGQADSFRITPPSGGSAKYVRPLGVALTQEHPPETREPERLSDRTTVCKLGV